MILTAHGTGTRVTHERSRLTGEWTRRVIQSYTDQKCQTASVA